MPDTSRYRFGPFSLEPAIRQLFRDSTEVTLPPKAFDILVLLVRTRDRVVTKQELLDAVWGETAVTDNTLTQRIKEIREALGDDAQEPRYVRTMSRVGYRFVGDVVEEAASDRAEMAAAAPERVGPQLSAVGPAVEPQPNAEAHVSAAEPIPRTDSPRSARWPIYTAAITIVAVGVLAVWFGAFWRPLGESREPRNRRVSTFDGSHRSASLSPDGRMAAFLMDVDGVPQVWITSIGSGSPVQITFGPVPAGRPRWSPLGDQIVFERRDQGIWSVPPLGGTARQILETGHSPNFSADGSTIVFEVGRVNPKPTRWGIRLANADGSNPRPVEGTPETRNWDEPTRPALSPDGQWIAFFRHVEGPRGDLWVVRAGGGDARELTHDEHEGGAPVWTSDSRAVVFSSARGGSRTLWKVPLASGPIESLTTGAGSDDEPDISRDGRSLIYTNFRNHHALAAWDPTVGQRQTVIERPLPFIMPDVSPRGDRVAFFMQAGADVQIFTVGIDGRDLRQLTYGTGQENIHPSWSWDGRFIYYYRQKPESSWRRIGIDGQGDTEVVKGWRWATQNNPEVDPSGRYVLYTRIGFDTGDYSKDTTYVYDLANGTERALDAPHLPYGAMVAGWPAGGRLAPRRHGRRVRDRQRPMPHARARHTASVVE